MNPYRPRLEMSPLSVECTACHAKFGEQCTTTGGQPRLPHAPREKLATNPMSCPSCGAGYGEPCRKVSGALSMYPHRARLRVHMSTHENVNYVVMVNEHNRGLVKFRLAPSGGNTREFDDLELAIEFAKANDVDEVDVVFPDGDVHSIPLLVRGVYRPGQPGTTRNDG